MEKIITCYHSSIGGAFYKSAVNYLDTYEKYDQGNGLVEMYDGVEESKIIFVVCAASYIEALANYYLSVRLDPSQFELLEQSPVVDKWTIVPSLIVKSYSFPKGESLYEDLNTLIQRRNGIAHAKPELIVAGKKHHSGNHPRSEIEHKKVLKWITLPGRLIEHLRTQDQSDEFSTFYGIYWYDARRQQGVKQLRRYPAFKKLNC